MSSGPPAGGSGDDGVTGGESLRCRQCVVSAGKLGETESGDRDGVFRLRNGSSTKGMATLLRTWYGAICLGTPTDQTVMTNSKVGIFFLFRRFQVTSFKSFTSLLY